MSIYIDATFDSITKIAFIGYSDNFMITTGVKKIKVKDINRAEFEALNFAISKIGKDNLFLTDSENVIRKSKSLNIDIEYIPREDNIADIIVSAAKENHHGKLKAYREKNR